MGVLHKLFSPRLIKLTLEPLLYIFSYRKDDVELKLRLFKKILVVRLDEIGDVAMTSSFIRELRHNAPEAKITLIVKPQVYNMVELCPYVDEVLVYDWSGKGLMDHLKKFHRMLLLAKQKLWSKKYDLGINPRYDADGYFAGLLLYVSGANVRIGYSEKVMPDKMIANKNYDKFYTNTIFGDGVKHEVERNLDVIKFLGGKIEKEQLELWADIKDESVVEKLFLAHDVKSQDLKIVLVPSASSLARAWGINNFISLALYLSKNYAAKIFVIGAKDAVIYGREISEKVQIIDCTNKLTLRESFVLISQCDMYIGGDTGPMHLAVAAQVPIIEISSFPATKSKKNHANSPYRFAPYRVPYIVLQPQKTIKPCVEFCSSNVAHCINQITVDEVENAVKSLYKEILSESREDRMKNMRKYNGGGVKTTLSNRELNIYTWCFCHKCKNEPWRTNMGSVYHKAEAMLVC